MKSKSCWRIYNNVNIPRMIWMNVCAKCGWMWKMVTKFPFGSKFQDEDWVEMMGEKKTTAV